MTLDPITTAQVIHEGAVRLRPFMEDEPTLRDIVWALLQEAAKVDRSISRPGPSRSVTMNIQTYWEPHEIAQAYNEALTELREAEKQERLPQEYYKPDDAREAPDASAHRRYLEVMGWLRFVTAKRRVGARRRQMLVFALASGMGARRAMDVFPEEQFQNPRAVYGARDRALNQIETEIRRCLRRSAILAA